MKNYILIIAIFLLNTSFSNAQEKKNELFIGLSPFNGNELKSTLGTATLSLFAEDVIFKTKSIGFYTLGYRYKIEEKLTFTATMHYTGSNISIKSADQTIEGKNRAFIFSFGLDYTYYTNKKTQLYSGLRYVSAFPKESTVTQK